MVIYPLLDVLGSNQPCNWNPAICLAKFYEKRRWPNPDYPLSSNRISSTCITKTVQIQTQQDDTLTNSESNLPDIRLFCECGIIKPSRVKVLSVWVSK